MKAKFFNYRPMFLIFLCYAFGVISVYYFLYKDVRIALFLLLVFIGVLLFYSYYYKTFSFVFIALFACLFGGTLFLNQLSQFDEYIDIPPGSEIIGVVKSVTSNEYNMFIIQKVKINGKSYSGNIQVFSTDFLMDYDDIVDSKIRFVAEESEKNVLNDVSYIPYMLGNDSRYYIKTSSIEILKSDKTLGTKIRTKVKNNMLKYLDNENVELMYSAFFGDKLELNDELYDAYKITGVAHILAVSGLHVGLVATILKFFLKLFRAKSSVVAIVVTLCLLFYCYLCDFAPSVMRATIMTSALNFSAIFNKEYDALSSMGLAGIIISVFNPSAIINLSFVLSFVCILGIRMFYTPCEKFLKKLNIYSKFTSALAMSILINLTISFVTLYAFHTLNLTGILLNIIVLPIFSFLFICLFILSLLALFLPFIKMFFIPFNPVLNCLNNIVNFSSKIGLTLEGIGASLVTVVLFLLACMFVSKFNIKKKTKKLATILVSFCCVALDICFLFLLQ